MFFRIWRMSVKAVVAALLGDFSCLYLDRWPNIFKRINAVSASMGMQ
jgi:hypothetical protein